MPILEVLQVRLKDGISEQDPSLLENFSTVRRKIKTNSRFYLCKEDPRLVFILGQWSSLEAHKAFLASPERDEILSAQDHQVEFKWMAHMEFSGMSHLPLDAPVLAISRYFFSGDDNQEISQALGEIVTAVQHRANSFQVVAGWRCDSEPRNDEYFEFTGWDSKEAHDQFTAQLAKTRSHLTANGSQPMEVYHAVDMELM